MQELVILKNKEAVTTSLQVAESFEKKHQHVLRDIDALKKDVSNFGQMFVEGNEPDSYGRNRRVFFISRDGFFLLAKICQKTSQCLNQLLKEAKSYS